MIRLDQLDDIDRQLLSILQLNAREPVAEIARRLGVARTTVIARIARLEQPASSAAIPSSSGATWSIPACRPMWASPCSRAPGAT
jgi:hypothetical protein